MNKKLLFPVLVLPLILVGCGGNENSSSENISSDKVSSSENVSSSHSSSSSDDYGIFNPSIGESDTNKDEVSRNYEIYPIIEKTTDRSLQLSSSIGEQIHSSAFVISLIQINLF